MKFKKILRFSLLIYSIITFLNAVSLYFLPHFSLLSNFTVIRTMFIAFAEKKYWLIIIALLINSTFFFSALCRKNGRIMFSVISFIIEIIDLFFVSFLLIESIVDEHNISLIYIPHIILDLYILCILSRAIRGRFSDWTSCQNVSLTICTGLCRLGCPFIFHLK